MRFRFAVCLALGAALAIPAGGQQRAPEQPLSPLLMPLGARLAATSRDSAPADPPTRFKPSGGRIALGAYIDSLTPDPDQRASIRALVEAVFAAYEAAAEKAGYSNDLAGALSFYLAASYRALKGGEKLEESASARMVSQIQAALDTPEMRAATDADKQQLYETFLMLGGLLGARQELAGDDAARAELRPLGAEGLKYLLQIDPARVAITAEGIRIAPHAGPASTPASASEGGMLQYTPPPGWERAEEGGSVRFALVKEDFYSPAHSAIQLFPSIPGADLKQQCGRLWREQVFAVAETDEKPFIMVRLLSPGVRCAFLTRNVRHRENGRYFSATLLLVDGGAKAFPILLLQSGDFKQHQAAVDAFLRSVRVPGGAPKKALATKRELARSWTTGASSSLNYVTPSGAYAGSSTVAYVQHLNMKADGTYSGSFAGFSNTTRAREQSRGRYRLDGDVLTFTDTLHGGKVTKKRLLGVGPGPDGKGPLMLLLGTDYPLTWPNIEMYGERYRVAR